jgi:hypothetical protein
METFKHGSEAAWRVTSSLRKAVKDQIRQKGFSFFGIQGPWYTVGWRMSVLIEKTYGRARLIQCMCDQRLLLATYNSAALKHNRKAKQPLELWSTAVVNGVEVRK